MQKIIPHLWFDKEAGEAARFYTSLFPNSSLLSSSILSDTPSGTVEIQSINVSGQEFQLLSAGPYFKFTPAISFLVACDSAEEVDGFWKKLYAGKELMPLDSYPFSERYGWLEDKYGVSWQFMYMKGFSPKQKIIPTLMFVGDVAGKSEEAMRRYASIFPDSAVGDMLRWEAGEEPNKAGTVKHGEFTLGGTVFAAMDSAYEHDFTFNEAISFIVNCDTQEEIDRYWNALSAVPESEQCGWLKDRYGVSWQIVPSMMEGLMGGTPEQTARATAAMLKMKKLDIEGLRKARDGD